MNNINTLKNRTLFSGDNLPILRGLNTDSIDLIYLDPPFNSNRHYAAPIGSQAAGAAFKDAWTFEDTDDAWWGEIADEHPGLYKVLDAAGEVGGHGSKAYLIYMAVRILEMRRLLKDTGSLYLHCDPTMSHPLKMLLDAIFGVHGFQNEIIWAYKRWPVASHRFQRMHDVLFYYAQSGDKKHTFNPLYMPKSDKSSAQGKTWKSVFDEAGRRKSIMLDTPTKGVPLPDVWEISIINPVAKERVGYPTQKPLKLLQRIIQASSNPGDMVLDPFCGCATTCVAAEQLGRQWVGIDISELAAQLVKDRMRREVNIGDDQIPTLLGSLIHRTDIPQRHAPKPSKDIKKILFGRQRGYCNGCKRDFPYQNMTKDHIIPTAKGGADTDDNLQLLCHHCNAVKGSRLSMPELHAELKKRGLMAD